MRGSESSKRKMFPSEPTLFRMRREVVSSMRTVSPVRVMSAIVPGSSRRSWKGRTAEMPDAGRRVLLRTGDQRHEQEETANNTGFHSGLTLRAPCLQDFHTAIPLRLKSGRSRSHRTSVRHLARAPRRHRRTSCLSKLGARQLRTHRAVTLKQATLCTFPAPAFLCVWLPALRESSNRPANQPRGWIVHRPCPALHRQFGRCSAPALVSRWWVGTRPQSLQLPGKSPRKNLAKPSVERCWRPD